MLFNLSKGYIIEVIRQIWITFKEKAGFQAKKNASCGGWGVEVGVIIYNLFCDWMIIILKNNVKHFNENNSQIIHLNPI